METIGLKFSDLASFTDKQKEASATADEYQFTLYGGSRGPGKSFWLRWDTLREVIKLTKQGILRPKAALFCEDYPSLKDRQISKIDVEFPRWLGEVTETKTNALGFHLHERYGSGSILLRNLDDVGKYVSAEFAAISVDELTKNEVGIFDILRGSLRCPGVPKPRFRAATNPGEQGHAWVKAFWIDRQFPKEMTRLAKEFKFVKALPSDNPYLSQDYFDMLESLPPDLAEAWRWGNWDIFEGQFFKDLRRDKHGFTGAPPPGRTFRSIDYGETAPSSVHWWRVDYNKEVWIYKELYETGLIYSQLADKILDMTDDSEKIDYTVASPDMFATSRGTGVVGSEIFAGKGIPLICAQDERINGWRHMKEYIYHRRLHVNTDTCPNWWRTVPTRIFSKTDPEDMSDTGEDHCAEDTRYGLQSRPKAQARVVKTVHRFSSQWAQMTREKHTLDKEILLGR